MLAELKRRLREINDLNAASDVLNWDQATYMPEGGADARGRQRAMLNRLAHERTVEPAIGRLIDRLTRYGENQPYDSDDASLIRVARRDFQKNIKIPSVWKDIHSGQTLHFTAPKMQFYEKHLDNAVWYARHALSIDEDRAEFARVEWGSAKNSGPPRPDSYPDWLDQIWFAGVHSDIGGGYTENESRLSDITLAWMADAAENLPNGSTANGAGIKVDRRYLQLYPDPRGPQHDAREPGYFGGGLKWPKALRKIDPDAPLHGSVYQRFAADKVQHFYEMKPYRPENLMNHENLQKYYSNEPIDG